MARNELPYFPFYVDDFACDGKVEAMTTRQVGAYILLLCKSWREHPVGTLPDNDAVLSRWARLTPEEWQEDKPAVMPAFTFGADSRWHQKRMRQEFAKLQTQRKNRIERAKKGGEAFRNKLNAHKKLEATSPPEAGLETACGPPRASDSDSFSLSGSEESSENRKPKTEHSAIEAEFEARWARWPSAGRKEKAKCLRKWVARFRGMGDGKREFLLAQIDVGIDKWMRSQEFANGFVHSFERFLNNSRWEESPAPVGSVVVSPQAPSKIQKTAEIFLAQKEAGWV